MATKKIDEKKTLKYAVAFYFCTSGKVNFMLGKKMYQHINTVYDQREDGRDSRHYRGQEGILYFHGVPDR